MLQRQAVQQVAQFDDFTRHRFGDGEADDFRVGGDVVNEAGGSGGVQAVWFVADGDFQVAGFQHVQIEMHQHLAFARLFQPGQYRAGVAIGLRAGNGLDAPVFAPLLGGFAKIAQADNERILMADFVFGQ